MTARAPLLQRLELGDALPDAIAMIDARGATITRRALASRARNVAKGLILAGLAPGDRVLFAVAPGVDTIVWMLGIVEAGGVLVAADPGAGDTRFRSQMGLIRPRWVVADSRLLAASRSRMLRALVGLRGWTLPELGALDATRIAVGARIPGTNAIAGWRIEQMGRDGDTQLPLLDDDERAVIVVFTSGTTEAPRGAVHSHRSISATLDIVGESLRLRREHVLYASDVHLVLPALFAGARVIVPRPGRLSPRRMVQALRQHGVTHCFAVTADAQALAEYLTTRGSALPATVCDVIVGAAPVRAGFLRRFQNVLPAGARAWCVYGMTELLPAALVTLEEKLAYRGEGDLLGRLAPGVRARVTDDGELVLRGPNLFTGYAGAPAVDEHHTGDLARIDALDRLVLLGRRKDMIIRGRHNVYPELHEPVIERIAGVRRCAMVGVFDERAADERIVLVVEPNDGANERHLHRAVSHAVRAGKSCIDEAARPDLVVVAQLPVSGRSRKVDKRALRELARGWLAS